MAPHAHTIRHGGERGVSFIEVVVWVGIFTLVMGAIVSTLLYIYRTNGYAIEQAYAISSAQRGIDKVVRILREAAYANDGAFPVVSIATSSITLYADTDNDAYIEKVRYVIAPATTSTQVLYEVIVKPAGDPPVYTATPATSTLSEYVHNIDQNVNAFAYYDKNGALITDYTKIGDVRFVTVTLVVDVNPQRAPALLTFRSSATLRNLLGQ